MLLSVVLLQSSQVEDYGGVRGWLCVCVYIQYHTYIYHTMMLFFFTGVMVAAHVYLMGKTPVTEFIPSFSKTRHPNR